MIRDTIYNDLKEQGLLLSDSAALKLPPIRPPKPTLMRQLGGPLTPDFKLPEGPHKIVILPVLNSVVLVARANTLLCYKYEINKQTGAPVFQQPKVLNLTYAVRNLHMCDSRFLNDRGEVPFLAEAQDQLTLFYLDLKEFKLIERNSLSYSNLFNVHFLFEKEVLLVTRNLELHHYCIQSGTIKLKAKIPSGIPDVPKDQYIHTCQVVGSIDEEQDSTVAMFYLIKKIKKKHEESAPNYQVLRVKEYQRSFDGTFEVIPESFTVLSNNHSCVLPETFDIWGIDGYYCIETRKEIFILKKKFKKYLFIDNVMEKIHDHSLKLNQGAIVSSYGNESMELSVIQFGDPKCVSRILDTIELSPEEASGFRLLWPFKNEKETCLMIVFEKEKQLIFRNVIKMEPMKKMLDIVKKCDKSKISMVQEIAVNLGINRRDFYLTLWQNSDRQMSDIYTFLLPCGDVSSIKKEIRQTMRRKKIAVAQFFKILQKIAQIIKAELRNNLSQQMLKEYIKNDFLLRKIKLKQKDKFLDYRDLDKVYNSSIIDIFEEIVKNILYPQKKKLDPLHIMQEEPEKEIIELSHVFQEFKIVILENYKSFIGAFLACFQDNQIVNVIRNYYYLLPFFPFKIEMIMHENEFKTEVQLNQEMQRRHNGQNQWFCHMNSIEFNRELSKQRIERQLHEYYPTSKITDAINTLVNSTYGGSEKLRKHGLISSTIQEYSEKLKGIYDIKLFLKVCEYANQTDPYSDQDISGELVDIFKTHNKLTGQAYKTVRLYSSMHKFMLKNDFCEKKDGREKAGFSIEELLQFTSEDLVALFFLQNRQRKQFIFNEFRDLYVKLYGDAIQFNKVIEKFINSENCSRIELQIFIKEVLNKGIDFQIDNQPLIELLIDGFCLKLQIREDTDTKHFLELMEEIELSKALGMKINKIMQIRRCLGILNIFHCEKMTYYAMLAAQQGNEIFKILLDRYFNQQLKRESVRIQDEEVNLDFCRNMLTVLLYILETIYYDVSEKDLLLTYGQILIEWKQFDVIKGILYDEDVLEKLSIDKSQYIEELVRNAIATIYTDPSIEFDEEVKKQIEEILDILPPENTSLRNQELAKLKLVQIFESWQVVVHPFDIYSVTEEWNYNNGREQFIVNLFDVYLDRLTLASLQSIYTFLEYTAENRGEEQKEVNIANTEFVRFVLMFAQRLLSQNRYPQIIEIFAFVKQMKDTAIEYELLTEAFLKSVCQHYPELDQIQQGKQLIQYFTQNIFDDHLLHQLFQTNFASGKFGHEVDRESTILVDTNMSFHKHKVEIEVDLLWKIVNDEVNDRKNQNKLNRSFNEQIFYSYYFLLMVFRNHSNGLRKLDHITYNLELLTELLFRLEASIDENSGLWAINSYYIFKSFIKGLLLIGVARVKKSNQGISTQQFAKQEENVQIIKNALKQNKAQNKDLLDSIQRLQAIANFSKSTKKNEKELRYERSKLEEEKNKPKEPQPEPEVKEVVNNATMNLKVMREMKYEFTQLSNLSVNYISQKEVLEAIYNKAFEDKQQSRMDRRQAGGNQLFLTGINSKSIGGAAQQDIVDKLKNEQIDSLRNESKEKLIPSVRAVYDDGSLDFFTIMNILDDLKLGDQRKIDIGRLCKIYLGDIDPSDLKLIFPFDFFLEIQPYVPEELPEKAYEMVRRNLQDLFISHDNEYVRSLALLLGSVLETSSIIDRIYLDTLISVGERYSFGKQSVILVRMLLNQLSQNAPELLKQNIETVLKAYRESTELKSIVKYELKELFSKQENLAKLIQEA